MFFEVCFILLDYSVCKVCNIQLQWINFVLLVIYFLSIILSIVCNNIVFREYCIQKISEKKLIYQILFVFKLLFGCKVSIFLRLREYQLNKLIYDDIIRFLVMSRSYVRVLLIKVQFKYKDFVSWFGFCYFCSRDLDIKYLFCNRDYVIYYLYKEELESFFILKLILICKLVKRIVF